MSLPRKPTARASRTCALDLGRARVGVAIDDDLGLMAHPRGTFSGRDRKALVADIARFAKDEGVGHVVVGLPLNMNGSEGPGAREARAIAQAIADATGLAVEMWDERLTTVQAHRALSDSEVRGRDRRDRIDEAAACAILQSWLDARRGGG
jgi:putative Holliday junction resolvase